jgi:hypothetical protein
MMAAVNRIDCFHLDQRRGLVMEECSVAERCTFLVRSV